jgi:hypothetical protein
LNFAAQKFFVGLVDFFSIFLPGATLAYVIRDWVYSTFLGPNMHPPIDRGEAGLVFLFGSYLLGHLIFLLATILDERIYHPLRALIDWGQITKRLVKDKDLSTHLATPACHFRFVVWHRCRRGRHAGATNEGARSRPWKANTPSTLIQWWQGALDEGPACRFVGRATLRGRFQILFFVVLGALSAIYALRQQEPAVRLGFIGMLPARPMALYRSALQSDTTSILVRTHAGCGQGQTSACTAR